MRKREFMNELRSRLSDLSKEERDDALNFYDELIEDTIDKTGKREEDVVYNLGSIDDIVNKIKGTNQKIHYEETPIEPEVVEETHIYTNNESKEENNKTKKSKKKFSNSESMVLKIVLIVVTFPLWIGLVAGIIGTVVGLDAAFVGIGIGGFGAIIGGFAQMTTNLLEGATACGVGLILLGLSFIFTPLMIKASIGIVKLFIKLIKWIAGGTKKEAE